MPDVNELGLIPAQRFELFDTRYYRNEHNQSGPSVTTIIKDAMGPDLTDWYARCAAREALQLNKNTQIPAILADQKIWERDLVNEAATSAQRIGLQHAAVGELFHDFMWSGELDNEIAEALPPNFKHMLNTLMSNWAQIIGTWEILPILTEFKLIGTTFDNFVFGGTLDAVVEDKDGLRILLEVKTSRELSPSHAVQCAAYEHALNETYDLKVNNAYVLRLDKYKRDTFDYWEVNLPKAYARFENCVQLYNCQSEIWVETRE